MWNCSYTSTSKACAATVLSLFIAAGCGNASTAVGERGDTDVNSSLSANKVLENADGLAASADSSRILAFEYREAYLPENISWKQSELNGENNVGRDWGIWGHNLYRVVGKNADASVYATVDGKQYDGQYCFSSDTLYNLVKEYILHKFGDGFASSSQFVIMPNDDGVACGCSKCTEAGNTVGNATPSVARFVAKLAHEFPGHRFFMGAYSSTTTPPAEVMPDNVGVIVSAMSWPLAVNSGRRLTDFDAAVAEWAAKCHCVYVWDYINNFDDYFTPFPILSVMQRRLQHFAEIGVDGVFLNGSGEDYSAFSWLHNYVLAALMSDTSRDVEGLVRDYFTQHFPVAGAMLAKQYMQWDNKAKKCKKLNIYAPIDQAMAYIGSENEFRAFYNSLSKIANAATAEERGMLDQLVTAMSYTMLEVARATGNIDKKDEVEAWLQSLACAGRYAGMEKISESGLTVQDYIKCWEMSILGHEQDNLLAGLELKALSRLDGGYSNLSMLTDCTNGLPCGYHYGWLISSIGDGLEIEIPLPRQARRLEVSFLKLTRHRIALPVSIELVQNGIVVAKQVADDAAEVDLLREDSRRLVYSFDVGRIAAAGADALLLRVTRPKGKNNHIAIDEIRLKQ